MDPADFIELTIAARDGIGGHVGNFVTALFAYLLMTYFVADNLSRVQIWGISLIYSVYAFLPANAAFQDITVHASLMEQFAVQHPAEAAIYIQYGDSHPIGWAVIAFISWASSIAFMIQRRTRSKSHGDA